MVQYILSLFAIRNDTDQKGTIESIEKGSDFHGVTVWTLIFAIFIASIGLNMNSTAVIIGAMLISPLMGPIMGAGLAMGIYDFELMKKSLRNLAVMTILSVSTSTIYFLISPISDAQSELLARTFPTVYDVLIAIFGGATGIVAGSRKDKLTNAIPGVAIATALMPPLCTAGYGLANGNMKYFLGAMYLYIINSVFIGVTTWVFVRYFNFERRTYLDPGFDRKIRRYIFITSFLIIIPSIFMAYNVITQSKFKKNANHFIVSNFTFDKTKILTTNYVNKPTEKYIEVTTVGEPLSVEMQAYLKKLLPQYELEGVELRIIQTNDRFGNEDKIENSRNEILANIKSKDDKIQFLEAEVLALRSKDRLLQNAAKEANILFPTLESISFGDMLVHNIKDLSTLSQVSVLVKWNKNSTDVDKKRLELFLKSRLELENLQVLETD
ncbi:MAG: DUF389 domain-containing protein [Leptospiraceae bacterium]|nr:DUF389 domain-containing protein [Leptospiraceae bacterium]